MCCGSPQPSRMTRGEDVTFEGETIEEFIMFFEEAYPVVEQMVKTIYV